MSIRSRISVRVSASSLSTLNISRSLPTLLRKLTVHVWFAVETRILAIFDAIDMEAVGIALESLKKNLDKEYICAYDNKKFLPWKIYDSIYINQ